jgi:hypothetical protein
VSRHSDATAEFAATDVRVGSTADLTAPKTKFRFAPESGLNSDITSCPKIANSGRSKPKSRRPI